MKRFLKVLGLLVFFSLFLTACKKTDKPSEPDPTPSLGTTIVSEPEPSTKPSPEPTPESSPTPEPTPIVKYVVTFDDLLEPFDVEVEEGKVVEEPAEPEEPGYDFLGWFIDDVKWDFENPVEKDITLQGKWKLNLKRVIFNNTTHVYDGTSRSILVAGAIAPHINISYANNEQVNAGVYEIVASFSDPKKLDLDIPDITATLTIEKADLSISLEDGTYTYDGIEKSLAIAGTLPEGFQVIYEENEKINAGVYTVKAIISGSNPNYNEWTSDLTATLTIEKAIVNLTFPDATFTYDGTPKQIGVVGNVPGDILLFYDEHIQTNAGVYQVEVVVSGDTDNYDVIIDRYIATLTIEKAVLTGVYFEDVVYTYESLYHELVITGELPEGVEATYNNNTRRQVGISEATVSFGSNYEEMTAYLVVLGSGITMTQKIKDVVYAAEYIYAGRYPQSLVTDANLIDAIDGVLIPNSRGYYVFDSNEYAKVTATPATGTQFRNGDTVVAGDVYYFLVESIKWRVVENDEGDLMLLSEDIIGYSIFYDKPGDRTIGGVTVYPNNYEHSTVRQLILDIYAEAFTSATKDIILSVEVDNSAGSTKYPDSNTYACANTNDVIHLLSYQEVMTKYGFETNLDRRAYASDYTIALGLGRSNGFSDYFTRSPENDNRLRVTYVYSTGGNGGINTGSKRGVRPVIKLKIE